MFSSIPPGIPTNVKYMQNGPSKQSNRFAIRVFQQSSTQPFPYPLNPTLDMGHRSLPSEQVPPDWYGKSAFNVPYGADYAVYPNLNHPPLIYEQSYGSKTTHISDFDDASSIATFSTFSPATSTDSMETLKSPVDSESLIDELEAPPALSYPVNAPATSQAIAISRSSSIHRLSDDHTPGQEFSVKMSNLSLRMATPFRPIDNVTPHPLCFPYMANDSASTVSELEVEERDRIARMNAEYNSVSSTNYFRRSSISSHVVRNTDDLHQVPSASSRHTSSNQAIGFSRLTSCQPLHPDLHFPPRVSGSANGASATFPTYASLDGTPPSVERVPSHLPIEDITRIKPNAFSEQPQPPIVAGRHDPALDSSNSSRSWNQRAPIVYPMKNTILSSSYSAHVKDSGGAQIAFPDQTCVNEVEQRKNRTCSVATPSGLSQDRSITESKTLNVITNSGQDDDTKLHNDDKQVKVQYIYQETASSTSSDNSRSHKYSHSSPLSHSSPRRQVPQPSEVDEGDWAAVGVILRNDTRTPGPQQRDRNLIEQEPVRHSPSGRRQPASQAVPNSPSRAFTEARIGTQSRENDVSKQQGILISSDSTHRNVCSGDIVPNITNPNRSHMLDTVLQRSSPVTRSSQQLTIASTLDHRRDPPYEVKHGPDFEREIGKELDQGQHSRNGATPQRLLSLGAPEKNVDPYTEREDDRQRLAVNVHVQSYLPREGEAALYNKPEASSGTVKSGSANEFSKRDSANQTTKLRDSTNLLPTPHDNSKPHFHNIQPPPLPPWTQSEIPRNSGCDERRLSPSVRIGSTQNDKHSSPTIKTVVDSGQTNAAVLAPLEPHRRYSDGDQVTPPIHPQLSGRSSAPLARSVRWNENLVAPSPVLAPPKRKGWFNRRGDQLWTNDGAYMSPRTGEGYPPDLDDYPECGEGWMNEDGVRIDMSHRRIPKSPPRSALKSSVKP